MGRIELILGSVAFRDFEIPSGINFGGRQRLAIHELTNGRRVIDSLGPDESEISFSGTFSGADATLRARMLNSLRAAGDASKLTWDVFVYTVVLSRFEAHYENPVWIPYHISCTVVRDESASAPSDPLPIGSSVQADLGVAATQCIDTDIDFTHAQNSVVASGSTTLGTAEYRDATSSIQLLQLAMSQELGSNEATLLSHSFGSSDGLISYLAISTTVAEQLAYLTCSSGYVGRAARNLTNAST